MQVHLIAVTPSGTTFLIEASLTGKIDLCAGGHTIASVEIQMAAAASRLRGTGPEELQGPANVLKHVWVRPEDLCWNGTPFKHEELIEDAAAVRERLKKEMMRGPLGENWP